MRALAQLLMVQVFLIFVPAVAGAQTGAALTGIVTDSSGAVLPGVTVEARSPALIEQLRSAVTDESGRYRIVDLRPGTYSMTFTLAGFASVFQAHAGRRNEGVVQVEGLSMGFQGMGVSFYVPDVGNAQEVNFNVLGGLGEAGTGGPVMNILPKVGGNEFHGTVFANGATSGLQGSNYTTALRNAGLRAP